MELAMQLDELHRPPVLQQDRECDRPEMLADERPRARRLGWDRRGTAAPGDAESVDDVLGLDAWPQDDAHLGQACAHLAETVRERALLGIEVGRLAQQRVAFDSEAFPFLRPVREPSVAGRIPDGRHADPPLSQSLVRGKIGEARCVRR